MERNDFLKSVEEKDERFETLKQLYPELFSDGNLNLDVFKDILNQSDLADGEDKTPGYYGLYWPGKRTAKQLAKKPATGTLEPVPGDGIDEDTTHNIYIEGDNLEVLRTLRNSYRGRVKMIYIDPPYNTGNDFVYPDDYSEPVQDYLKLTGQIDDKGKKLVSNPRTSGAYHRNWLNMMYARLLIAKELLSDNGVIFISIDDHEQSNLKLLCDDIFGEENFLANLVWRKKYTGGKGTSTFADYHEYILAYSRNIEALGEIAMARPDEEKDKFTEQDEYYEERGKFYTRPLKSNLDPRPTLVYPIELPDGTTCTTQWICAKETYLQLLEEGRIVFKDSKSSKYPVYKKFYENDGGGNVKIPSFIETSNNNEAKEEIKRLFNVQQTRDLPFQTPKPTKLLRLFIDNFTGDDDIILDFFSGSASTGEAVYRSMKDDLKKRKFILVQLPSKADNLEAAQTAGFQNICEIGKERIRRAIKCISSEKENLLKEETSIDLGFKVYRLVESNFIKFKPVKGQNKEALNKLYEQMDAMVDPLVDGWKTENVLEEIKLRQGFALDCQVEEIQDITSNKVYHLVDEARPITLYVCLDEKIDHKTVETLNIGKDDKFICLNSAIDDTTFARLADKERVQTL